MHTVYICASIDDVIGSFGDAATEALFHDVRSPRARRYPAELRRAMLRKLQQIVVSRSLDQLRTPPGNRLEALRGDMAGRYSIRVNRQWRVHFRWEGETAYDVTIEDYH